MAVASHAAAGERGRERSEVPCLIQSRRPAGTGQPASGTCPAAAVRIAAVPDPLAPQHISPALSGRCLDRDRPGADRAGGLTVTGRVATMAAKRAEPTVERDSTGAPAVSVSIQGRTVDIQAYTTFLRQLAASPWFTDVTPASSQTVIEADRPVTSFTVTVRYRVADSVYIRTIPLVQSVR